ncbi:putative phospho-N-acetylmuramoyl-pentapeptide-transferase [Gottschalkia purinilytica]|uniref:Putative phospho-N-acetylmuramoyl-pentapeptide-transferase n=1 Tax=Gottschalkia purinilytica TaxID=1503 RepID=A0A0L0W7I0_GOTPU|nr:phospho-N-acetylmuramoyl-pentapeptide-transferase [Gottschalkia purinilytica]KNF07417.1 putative phospho-N-acetylmuramoyl-pentapeptide-transferase [Gottschalkia purinilytica]
MNLDILSFIVGIIITIIITPFLYNMLLSSECTATNYRNEAIPVGMGLVFVLVQTVIIFLISIYKDTNILLVLGYVISMMLMGLIGAIDDLIGEKSVKGFKGHIKSLFKGELTTGGLKAIIGFLSAALISLVISESYVEMIINTFLIALFTNLINLFDLRPGRAGKMFIILGVILLLTAHETSFNFILLSALGIIIGYIRYDLKARAMMGDIGSNALGITLGIFCAITHPLKIKLIYLAILVLLHIISEFYSFSKIIEKNKILKFIDSLGR